MPVNQYFDWTASASRFVRFDTVRAGDVNAALDLVTSGLTAVAADTLRAIKFPVGTAVDQVITQTAGQRASRLLAFDASGNITSISGVFSYRGDWATATAYVARDAFRDPTSKNIYFVASAHTSGVLATDISAGRDVLAINVADVDAARVLAQTAATNASNSASTATTQAGLATTNGAAQVALATAQAAAAAASAATAAQTAGATVFVSGNNYAVGVPVYSPINFQTYRASTSGVRTTDPSLDSVNWVAITSASAQIGDVFTGTQIPTTGTWLPLTGGTYLQSSYTALYAQLGLIADRSNISGVYTTSTPSSLGTFPSMAFGAGVYVAVLQGTSTAYSSPDGITWTARSLGTSQTWNKVIFANGIFLAVANASTAAATSTDGITWTARTLPSASNWRSAAFGAGLFVIGSDSTTWATSPDGISWTARTGPAGTTSLGGVFFGNGIFLAFSSSVNGNAHTSADGINWTTRTMPLAENLTATTSGGGLFVAFSQATGSSQVTADGINWRVGTLPSLSGVNGYSFMIFAAGFYVIPGLNSTAGFISSDGVNWRQNQHAGAAFVPIAGAYNAGRIVMCQNSGSANNFARSSLFLTYNTTSQFAVPDVGPTVAGAKQWIKAL